ncbi:Small archaeal modifier protein 2 [uncultured archaeon]|nr:Small archaeal modifier protein 2 [uncultured archaeon]
MKINVKILSGGIRNQALEISSDSTYEDLLGTLHINPEIVIVFRKGEPVPLDETVTSDNVEIMRVVTGG